MKKFFLIAAFLLAGLLHLKAQSADDIINKYLNAVGGSDKIKAISTMKMTGTMDVGGGVQIPFITYFKRPGLMKIEATFQGMTQQIGVDANSGWQINPFMGSKDPEPMDADNFKIMKEQADFDGELVDYKDKGYTAEFLGLEDFEGTQVNKIKLENKNGDVITYYLDAESNLPLKQSQKFKMSDTEVEAQTIFGDYKNEGGVMMAHSFETSTPGQEGSQKFTFSTVEVNVPVDDAIFKMPPKPDTTK